MAFTIACPNFKKGLKMAFGPLGVKLEKIQSLLTIVVRYKKTSIFHFERYNFTIYIVNFFEKNLHIILIT
jgi:hypothetical protein